MRTIKEMIALLAGLFIIGVAGGLERNMLEIRQAVIFWAIAISVIVIIILTNKKEEHR